jgi:hypothetical protein
MVKCNKGQVRRLKRALKRRPHVATRQRFQIVLLREGGMTQPEIAAAMGVSLSTVNRAHMAYDRGGLKALEPKPVGGRMRENMTLSEEAALLAGFAKAAGAGEMLNIHDLRAAYEKAIGHMRSAQLPVGDFASGAGCVKRRWGRARARGTGKSRAPHGEPPVQLVLFTLDPKSGSPISVVCSWIPPSC